MLKASCHTGGKHEYLRQTYIIPYNDTIRTRNEKLNANKKFSSYSYLTIHHDVE